MTENLTELYWRDIKESTPLKREEEVELFKLAKTGDEQARQKIVNANLRFVVSVARQYKDYGLTLAELISEGNVGLMEGVKRFDETRGFKFITYASGGSGRRFSRHWRNRARSPDHP
jgi:RNA polymerase primary sigma factor